MQQEEVDEEEEGKRGCKKLIEKKVLRSSMTATHGTHERLDPALSLPDEEEDERRTHATCYLYCHPFRAVAYGKRCGYFLRQTRQDKIILLKVAITPGRSLPILRSGSMCMCVTKGYSQESKH